MVIEIAFNQLPDLREKLFRSSGAGGALSSYSELLLAADRPVPADQGQDSKL